MPSRCRNDPQEWEFRLGRWGVSLFRNLPVVRLEVWLITPWRGDVCYWELWGKRDGRRRTAPR